MAVTAKEVQSLYLAYFGRPAEQAGLTYWTGQATATTSQVSASFAQQPEYTSVFGGLNRVQTIQELYTNLFNRSASDAELSYWNTSSTTTVDKLALALVNGAIGNDTITLSNKVAISQVLTTQAGANGTQASLTAAGNAVGFGTVFEGNANTTPAQEAATRFAQIRDGLVNQTQFSIIGDNIVNGSGFTAGTTVSGVFQPSLSFFNATTGTLNATNAGVVSITLPDDSKVTALTVNGTVGDVAGVTANATTLTFNETLATGATAQVLTALNLGLSNSVVAPTVTTINAVAVDSLTTINASTSSAALTIDTTIGSAVSSLIKLSTLQGGSGNDTLTVSTVGAAGDTVAALTVNGNAGNDTIFGTTGTAALTINGGEGTDTITVTTTAATAATTVNAGAGNDTIRLTAGDFGAGNVHAVNIDLGAGNDTLAVTALTNLDGGRTTVAAINQDVVKVANFGAGDFLSLAGLTNGGAPAGALTVNNGSSFTSSDTLATALVKVLTGTAADANVAFQFGGNTYIAHSDGAANITAGDGLIELTGFQGTFANTVTAGVYSAA